MQTKAKNYDGSVIQELKYSSRTPPAKTPFIRPIINFVIEFGVATFVLRCGASSKRSGGSCVFFNAGINPEIGSEDLAY